MDMIHTVYGDIARESLDNDLERVVDKLYKLLAMFDEQNPTIKTYISGLIIEMMGRKFLIGYLEEDSDT